VSSRSLIMDACDHLAKPRLSPISMYRV